jgi:superfamily II DNA or RNA helicase
VHGLQVNAEGTVLRGKVDGSRARPYDVSVVISGQRRSRITTACSCPVGVACKHAAAVLLAAMAEARSLAPTPGRGRTVPPRPPPPPPDPLAGVIRGWLDTLAKAVREPEATGRGPVPERVLYILGTRAAATGRLLPELRIRAARPKKTGGYGAERDYHPHQLAARSARFVTAEDEVIGHLLRQASYFGSGLIPDNPESVDLLFRRMAATGRCHWLDKETPPLALGPERPARLGWRLTHAGEQVTEVVSDAADTVPLLAAAPWYVDPAAGLIGPLVFELPAQAVEALLQAPPILPEQAALVRRELERRFPGRSLPAPRDEVGIDIVGDPPIPCLTLVTEAFSPYGWSYARRGERSGHWIDLALLAFDYGGTLVDPADAPKELRRTEGERIRIHRRRPELERAAGAKLKRLGLEPSQMTPPAGFPPRRIALTLASAEAADWYRLVHLELPKLEAEGWRIELDESFRHKVVEAEGEWELSVGEKSGWWFSLELGVEIAGQRVPLLPILTEAAKALRARRDGGMEVPAGASLYAPLPDGRILAVPIDRVRPMLEALVELYDADAVGADGRIEVSLGQAAALAAIAEATRLRWLGGERLLELVERLKEASRVEPAAPPSGLMAELRPYQLQGLAWLQFIGHHGLGGILADDMGLGKTVQTLAHILAEKEAGRLGGPALVVAPTSLVPNWESEARRFAPALRVLRLHGPDRAQSFGAIGDHDLVLSTYALLPRDAEALLPVPWHMVVLDEAQAIKNPATKVARIACQLIARHRFCLSGTPIENHLGELWSELTFLMPGLLGDSRRFARAFRTPIEKKGDHERRAALAARVRPFILRRTKEQVEADLPPKTLIIRRIELAGDQLDLYETVRLAMHERVRQEIRSKGLARSRIVVLDALLKLRQVCCDPRLVKLQAARKVASSGKLAHLMDMLPELIEEGRRVLLFSQFTSMLDLIVPELDRLGIRFTQLRGDTADRKRPVESFQAGEVPLFLVSLKAGGVGLNLTAADTVILYDPWWNPAVEAQATDRAHRIGQTRPVFVYKLIAEGTIETRMLELQDRKRGLAAGIFDANARAFTGIDAADLELLLSPIA